MSTTVHDPEEVQAARTPYTGLRMTAEEFLQLPEDTQRYELLDGVVIVSPSPTPKHQRVVCEVLRQLANYLQQQEVGMVLQDIDVHLGRGPTGKDLVYRPDIIFVGRDQLSQVRERVVGPPRLAIEAISPASRRFDAETKKDDYERCGVQEYWLIDPQHETMTFYRLEGAKYAEVKPAEQTFSSEAVPGFKLDLARVRKTFKPW